MLDYALSKAAAISVDTHRQRVYAVITDKRGKIISEAANSFSKTSPATLHFGQRTGNPWKEYGHAECIAIARAARTGKKPHAIYIARAMKSGECGLSAPCEACALAIKEAGIKEIHYTI